VLIGGDPGIGKSTLLLQLAAAWPARTLYVSGEESARQVRLRADFGYVKHEPQTSGTWPAPSTRSDAETCACVCV